MLFLRSASVDANFYPRPPRGGRPVNRAHRFAVAIFLSTPSARRATGCHQFSPPAIPYFYPRPPRGGRPASVPPRSGQGRISIHALREEGDGRKHKALVVVLISIHALREEGDKSRSSSRYNGTAISIHALREEGDRQGSRTIGKVQSISIHALREEGDAFFYASSVSPPLFLSTPSARRATLGRQGGLTMMYISIHALREEGDKSPEKLGHA